MRILVISNVLGDFDYAVQQIKHMDVDLVVLIGYNGIHYNSGRDDYMLRDTVYLSKYFDFQVPLGTSKFYRYLGKGFDVPVYCLPSYGDNGFLCKKLSIKGTMTLKNFETIISGRVYDFNNKGEMLSFAGLGGKYTHWVKSSARKMKHCLFGNDEIINLMNQNLQHLDMLFLDDPIGGTNQDGYSDFNAKIGYNGKMIDTFDLFEKINSDVIFFGGLPCEPDIIDYRFAGGKTRTLVFCRDMKQMCYLYDTQTKWVSYV